MAKYKSKENKKIPYNVFRKGFVKTLLGVTVLAGSTLLLNGCSQGVDGKDGADGSTWLTGTSAPTISQGKAGDFYYDTDDYILYQKDDDSWNILLSNFGKPGVDAENGDVVVFNVTETEIQWKYSKQPDTAYETLVVLSELKGDVGDKVQLRVFNGEIQWKYSNEADTEYEGLITLQELTGAQGKKVEFTADGSYIKYKYEGESDDKYRNLIALSELKGSQGKSAYEVAKDAGFEGNEQKWLESLKGDSIVKVEIEYKMDNKGNEVAVYTITYSSGKVETVDVEIPSRAEYISLIYNEYQPLYKCEAGQEQTLQLNVEYQNGTRAVVDVTEDMFIVGEGYERINFQQVGTYNIKISYRGKSLTQEVKVVDPNDTTVQSVQINERNVVMLLDTETPSIETNNFLGLGLHYTMVNGRSEYVSLADPNVTVNMPDANSLSSGQKTEVEVLYGGKSAYLNVLPVSAEEMATLEKSRADYVGNTEIYCNLNSEPFTEEDYISFYYRKDDEDFIYNKFATTEMIKAEGNIDFASDAEGTTDYSFVVEGWTIDDQLEITVYDLDDLTIEYSSMEAVKINSDLSSKTVEIYGKTSEIEEVFIEVPYSLLEIAGTVDVSKVGRQSVSYTYNEKSGTLYFEVFDPSVCNIASIYIQNSDNLPTFEKGGDLNKYLEDNFIGKTMSVFYHEPIGNKTYEDVKITKDIIDTTEFNVNVLGDQKIKISYTLKGQTQGYTLSKTVNVVANVENAQVVATYNVSEILTFQMGSRPAATVKLYDNEVAELYAQGGELISQISYKESYLASNIFCYTDLNMGGDGYLAIDKTNNKLGYYMPAEKTVKETFTTSWDIHDVDIPMEIMVYGEESYTGVGEYFALVQMDLTIMEMGKVPYVTVMVNISEDDGARTIAALGRNFTINQDKSLTEITE